MKLKNWKYNLFESEFDASKFKPKSLLNKDLWSKGELDSDIKDKLIEIAEDFYDHLKKEVKDIPEMEDVIFTGSLASYNYHKLSDIDLHMILDFSKFKKHKDLLEKYFAAKRINWNRVHDIFINNHEVEIYVQDKNEDHMANGIYSLKDSKWLKIPKKEEVSIDMESAKKKYINISNEIEELENLYVNKEYKKVHSKSLVLRDKIKNMRQSGLSDEGIYSAENIAFKLLRNNLDLEKLSDLKNKSYDKIMSFSNKTNLKINISENWKTFINKEEN